VCVADERDCAVSAVGCIAITSESSTATIVHMGVCTGPTPCQKFKTKNCLNFIG